MHRTIRAAISLALAGTALGAAGVSMADQNTAASAATLQEVIVTAEKHKENIQDVPISVSAVTGQMLAAQHVRNIEDLANSLPNVQINSFSNSPDSAVFTIRGIGVNDADPYVGTTVSVVQDGVVVGVNTAALLSLFDIDRIEVLRGPQGTLFGANTTGGVINIITKQPTGKPGGEVEVTGGNFGRLDVNAAVNVPITDKLAGKVTVMHTGRDGYFTNSVDGTKLGQLDVTAMRGYLKYEPTDGYNATLIAEYDRTRDGSQTGVNFSDSSQALYVPGYTDLGIRFVRGLTPGIPNQDNRDTYALTLTQNARTAIGNVVSITSYRRYDNALYSDDDATNLQLLQTRRISSQHQLSQELRTDVNLGSRTELIAGVYGFYQHYWLDQGGELDGFLRGLGQPQTQAQTNWSASGFAHLWHDLTDKLRLQAGIRFSHEETTATSTTANTFTMIPGALSSFDDPIIPGTYILAKGDKSWNNVAYKVGLDYKIRPTIMAYGYYARGFKSGGFTGRIAQAQDIGPFNPEYVDTFEAGVKSDLLDHRLRANFDAFYNLYRDMQVVQNITYLNGANSASIRNAGRAYTRGLEMDLAAMPVNGLTLNAALAFLQARYTKYDTLVLNPATGLLEPVSYAGNQLMNAPKWSGSASASYSLPMGTGATTAMMEYSYAGSKYTNFEDLPQERVGAIQLVNAKLSWAPDEGSWSIGLYGRNLLNKHYYAQKLYLVGTVGFASLGPPREYGVTFDYKWR